LNQKKIAVYYLILSVIGAALMIVVSGFAPSNEHSFHLFDKLVVGGAFILSCIGGICVAIKPHWIKSPKQGSHDEKQHHIKVRGYQGHHPDCEQFTHHTIKIKNHILCPGCNGLALGSIISVFLMGIYIVFPNEVSPIILHSFIILGMILIALNYIEIVIPTRMAYLHLIFNVFLVISFFFIVISIFHLTGSTLYGMFAVLLSFLWLDTRIQLSNWRHSKVCLHCSEACKVY
jgi:hypothetical protein